MELGTEWRKLGDYIQDEKVTALGEQGRGLWEKVWKKELMRTALISQFQNGGLGCSKRKLAHIMIRYF